MPAPATLTGQDLGEAEGASPPLLNQVLTGSNVGITRTQYITLRVLTLRSPVPGPVAVAGLDEGGADSAGNVPVILPGIPRSCHATWMSGWSRSVS